MSFISCSPFTKYSFAPSANACSRNRNPDNPEKNTTGIWRAFSHIRNSASTVKPCLSGKITSNRIQSIGISFKISRRCDHEYASYAHTPALFSSQATYEANSSSSSATNTVFLSSVIPAYCTTRLMGLSPNAIFGIKP